MKKEWLLLAVIMLATLAGALMILRTFAPTLVGVPVDLQTVQVSTEVVPFFDGVLPDTRAEGLFIPDPYTGTRLQPLTPEAEGYTGPVDLLGFRNRSVPTIADLITIGDSQTFGSGVPVADTWPAQLTTALPPHTELYNVSTNGWGAVQYLYLFNKIVRLRPQVVVVAFSSGTDAVESVRLVYSVKRWAELGSSDKAPKYAPSAWPPKDKESWHATFADGVSTVFTPKSRLTANHRDYPATAEGYRIMAEVARRIAAKASELGIGVVFTVIPTKELALARKVAESQLTATADYQTLVDHEGQNVRELAEILGSLPHARYVDVVTPLQQAARTSTSLYPTDSNGHPLPIGYRLIARTLAPAVSSMIAPPLADGPVVVPHPVTGGDSLLLARGRTLWVVTQPALLRDNGWPVERIPRLPFRRVATYEFGGVLDRVDPARFGP